MVVSEGGREGGREGEREKLDGKRRNKDKVIYLFKSQQTSKQITKKDDETT